MSKQLGATGTSTHRELATSTRQRTRSRDALGTLARPMFEKLEDRRLMSVGVGAVWTGAATDLQWNTAGNWQADAVPAPGADVTIAPFGNSSVTINLATNVSVGNFTMNGGDFTLGGKQIAVNGNITQNGLYIIINDLKITHNATATINTDGNLLQVVNLSDGGGTFSLTKEGLGRLRLYNGTSTGLIHVNTGPAEVFETLTAPMTLESGTTLRAANGQVTSLISNGSTINFDDGDGGPTHFTSTGNVSFNAGTTLNMNLNADAGTESFSQVIVTGGASPSLTGSTLHLNVGGDFSQSVNHDITLVSNQTGHAITGIFTGLVEGAVTTVDSVPFRITYVGGSSHHDVVLEVIDTSPEIVTSMPRTTTSSAQPTLSILGNLQTTGKDTGLTYTWSVADAPNGARPVEFSENGTNSAKGVSARFHKAGVYQLRCIVANGSDTTSKVMTIRIRQVAKGLKLTPHAATIASGSSVQYGGYAYDQFGRPMLTRRTRAYDVTFGDSVIDADGMFTAGSIGHAGIQITIAGLSRILGATIV